MGYCITMIESTIRIKPKNIENILKTLGKYASTRELYYIDVCKVMRAEDIFDMMRAIRYEVILRDNVGYEIYQFNGEKLGDDFEIFTQIAPYIEDGYIEYQGEDGDLWRYVFKDGEVNVVYPTLVWE